VQVLLTRSGSRAILPAQPATASSPLRTPFASRPARDLGARLRDVYLAVILLLLAYPLASQPAPAAQNWGAVRLNGVSQPCRPAPLDADGTFLLPLSFIRSGLGVTADQDDTGLWELTYFGTSLALRRNTAALLLNDRPGQGVGRTRDVDGELFVPLGTLAWAFGWQGGVFGDATGRWAEITTEGAQVTNIRAGTRGETFRLVIDLDRPVPFSWRRRGPWLRITIPGYRRPTPTVRREHRLLTYSHPLVRSVRQVPGVGGCAEVVAELTQECEVDAFTLPDPPRIVVDLAPEPPPEGTRPQLRVAGPWQRRNFGTARGAATVNVLEVDLSDTPVWVQPVLANETIRGREKVIAMARREGALAAINGGFFERGGPPLGLLMINGEWITAPPRARTALVLSADGGAQIMPLAFRGSVTLPSGRTLPIAAVNQGHTYGHELVLFNRRWGRQVPGNLKTTAVAVDAGAAVLSVRSSSNQPLDIPDHGFALSAKGNYARLLTALKPRDRLIVTLRTAPPVPNLKHVLGGGPRLLEAGHVHITSETEGFRTDVAHGPAPRTAVGLTRQGHLLLVVVDGRGAGGSSGMTLYELARTMQQLGAVEAMNLDGGGSTTMVIGGRVVNRPSDGFSRRVSNALMVFAPADSRLAQNLGL